MWLVFISLIRDEKRCKVVDVCLYRYHTDKVDYGLPEPDALGHRALLILTPTQLTNHSPVSFLQPPRFMSVIDMSLKILISPACVYASAGACEER